MSWWTEDPVVSGKPKAEGDWWSSDPVFGASPKAKPVAPPPIKEEPLGPFGAGWKGAGSDLRTAGAAVSSALGFNQTADELLSEADKSRAEVARRYQPKVPSFTDIGKSGGVLGTIGDLGQYVYEKGAESLPQMGAALGAGALGMAAAPAAIPAAVAGVGAGTLAGLPFFVGQNIKEQIDEGKTLRETSLPVAAAAGTVQSALDTLVGKVLPGVGKAAAGGMLLRAVKKGVEGAGIEGLTEGLQQAIQIGQANPSKLFEMSPEVQKELAEAAVAGGLLGGTIGGVSGAANKRAAPTPVAEEVPTEQAVPPPVDYWPNGMGLPGEGSGTGLPEQGEAFKLPISNGGFQPQGTGLPQIPGTQPPLGIESGTGLPDFEKVDPPWIPQGAGLARPVGDPAPGIPSGTGLPDTNARMPPTGQKVFKDVQQRLLAAGRKPLVANAEARLWRERYETLGKQIGTDAYAAYKQSGVDITQGTKAPTNQAATGALNQNTLNQDAIKDEPLIAKHYSALGSALNRLPMKEGTGQQWLNALKKQGVKDDELVWTGMQDYLGSKDAPNYRFKAPEVQNWFKPYSLAVYEAKPDVTKTNHYGEYTLGSYGMNPESNYREVVLADDTQRADSYKSPHYGMVPNALAHYRTTDRVASDGLPVLMAEEFQSDWHQAGRQRGYSTPEAVQQADQKTQAAFRKYASTVQRVMQPENRARLENLTEYYARMGEAPTPDINAALQEYRASLQARNEATSGVPDAPFKETWPNLTFRHALMDAINMGKEYVAWPTGEQQNDRYGNPTEDRLKGMSQFYDKRIVDYANKLGKQFGSKVEQIDVSNASHEVTDRDVALLNELGVEIPEPTGTKVHALKITPAMRELVTKGGLPLFQRGKTPQGNITIEPSKATIRLFKTANASTFMHESAHLWLEEMVRYAPQNKDIAADLTDTRKWLGNDGAPFTREQHEKFARGFEQYLRSGRAPTNALADVFKKFAEWLQKIYKNATSLGVEVPAHIEKVYGRLLAADPNTESSITGDERTSPSAPATYGQTFNQDEDKKIAPNPVQKGVNWLQKTFDPFSQIPGSEQYRDLRNLAAGGAYAAEQAATKAKNLFSGLSLAEKNAVNTYMETSGASPTMVPASVRPQTVALKQQINGPLKRALIDSGLLPESVSSQNDDSYLPRLYLKHLIEGEGISKGGRLNRNYAKKRGDRAADELLAMGEVKDPGIRSYYALFRPLRDLKIMEFLNQVSQNQDWVLPESLVEWNGRKVTPQWLKDEADAIEETRMLAEPDPARRQGMKEIADRMRAAAREGLAALDQADYDNKQFVKLPDTRDFGPLRGMIVQKQIADDITGAVNFVRPDNWFDKWFGDRQSVLTKAMSAWKFLKVPMNPPSQVRNVVSNLILLNLSGIPIHKVAPRMVQAARDMAKDGPYYQIAKKYGVGQGTFSEQELYGISDELKRLEINDQSGLGGWKKVYKAMLKGADKVGNLYQRMEVWGKVAKIMDAMERQGMSESEAVREANKWLFDYSEVPQAVRRARQSPIGYPFLTFTYKVMPLMAEIAAKHPTRLLPYVALAYTVPAMVAASFDIDDDDPDKLRKALSQGLRRKNDMYLLPWKDDAGRWQFMDVGYFMPWQMPVDAARYLGKGAYKAATGDGKEGLQDIGSAIGATNVLSNPLFNIVTALTTGVDPFTDRPIADKRDPPRKQVMDILGYVWGLAAPSLAAPYGAAGQLLDKEAGTGMNRFGEPSNTYGQIAARAMGLNTYPVVPEAQRARNIQQMQREIQEVKSRLTYTLKDKSLTAEQRREVVEDFKEAMRDRQESLVKYIKESEPSARLRAAS